MFLREDEHDIQRHAKIDTGIGIVWIFPEQFANSVQAVVQRVFVQKHHLSGMHDIAVLIQITPEGIDQIHASGCVRKSLQRAGNKMSAFFF